MTSPANLDNRTGVNKLPASRKLAGWFWPAPAALGWYGARAGSQILLVTNHAPSIVRLEREFGTKYRILAIDAGGFSPAEASALGLVNWSDISQLLHWDQKIESNVKAFALPEMLRVLQQTADNSDQKIALEQLPEAPAGGADLPAVLMRLWLGLRLWFGQAVIFFLPLLIFGWPVMAIGLGSLLLAGLVAALILPWLPGSGLVKSTLTGLICAILMGLVLLVLSPSNMLIWLSVAGMGIGGFWMGIVFQGLKK